jgi:hypothetical protein
MSRSKLISMLFALAGLSTFSDAQAGDAWNSSAAGCPVVWGKPHIPITAQILANFNFKGSVSTGGLTAPAADILLVCNLPAHFATPNSINGFSIHYADGDGTGTATGIRATLKRVNLYTGQVNTIGTINSSTSAVTTFNALGTPIGDQPAQAGTCSYQRLRDDEAYFVEVRLKKVAGAQKGSTLYAVSVTNSCVG